MLNSLSNVLRRSHDSFELSDIEDFPLSTYQDNLNRYRELEGWYDSSALDETAEQEGREVSLYPVRINPIRGAVMKHAAVLFGDIVDDARPLVVPRMVPFESDEGSKKLAQEAEEALNMLWYENNGRAIQLRNGLLSQYLGGCVFKLTYTPWQSDNWRSIPIRIEVIHPKNFVGIADASDYWRLRRGWIIRTIPSDLAAEYGVPTDDEYAYMVEDWQPGSYKVMVNGEVASKAAGEIRKDMSGDNPFGVVPMVYIPHIRENGFYGRSLIEGLEGIVTEMNLRMADFGDAVNEDAHQWLAMRNVNGSPRIVELTSGVKVIDLRSNPSVAGNESQPDIFPLRQNIASDAMGKLWDRLYDQFRRDSYIPAVADGEDEGSQRSAMTLAFRMWPLASHVTMERVLWTTGLNWLNTIALRMMAKPEIAERMVEHGLPRITEKHTRMRMRQDWSSMFMRDRESIINEITARAAAKAASIDTLLELAGDVEDKEGEKKAIIAWLKLITEASAPPQNDLSEKSGKAPTTPKTKETEKK